MLHYDSQIFEHNELEKKKPQNIDCIICLKQDFIESKLFSSFFPQCFTFHYSTLCYWCDFNGSFALNQWKKKVNSDRNDEFCMEKKLISSSK